MSWNLEDSKDLSFYTDIDIEEPKNYKVVFFNDDYTTKEFVVEVLISRFHKSEAEAILLMETVHRSKSAVVGVYAYDIAATRVALTINDARTQGYPLRCELEAV